MPKEWMARAFKSKREKLIGKKLFNLMNTYCPHASFIPEIWQGHKNRGEGAWMALERLENFCSTTQNNASVA
jgi:N-acetylneuraminate synthase